MPSTSEFKKGLRILVDGQPWAIVEHTVQTPSARGGATLVKAKLRNVITGQFLEKTWKAGEMFVDPELTYRQAQFLYADADELHFMDQESFEQFALSRETLSEVAPWLHDGLEVRAIHFDGRIANVELPRVLTTRVLETEPAVRGNTASGKVLKRAIVAGGVEIQVPLYLEAGESIEVDPYEKRFIRRATHDHT